MSYWIVINGSGSRDTYLKVNKNGEKTEVAHPYDSGRTARVQTKLVFYSTTQPFTKRFLLHEKLPFYDNNDHRILGPDGVLYTTETPKVNYTQKNPWIKVTNRVSAVLKRDHTTGCIGIRVLGPNTSYLTFSFIPRTKGRLCPSSIVTSKPRVSCSGDTRTVTLSPKYKYYRLRVFSEHPSIIIIRKCIPCYSGSFSCSEGVPWCRFFTTSVIPLSPDLMRFR